MKNKILVLLYLGAISLQIMKNKILVLLYPGAISFEVMFAINFLGGFTAVDIVTSNSETHLDESGLKILPTVELVKLNISDYSALIVPGGNPDSIIFDESIKKLIRSGKDENILLCGICAGVLVLASSGVLKGETITHNYTLKYAPRELVNMTKQFWEETIYNEALVQVSGNILTALPNGYIELGLSIAEKLNFIDAKKKKSLISYHKQNIK